MKCSRRYPPVECTGRQDHNDRRKAKNASNAQDIFLTRAKTESPLATTTEKEFLQDVGLTVTTVPPQVGGILDALNASTSNNFPIKPSLRNTELFQLCKLKLMTSWEHDELISCSSSQCCAKLLVR